MFLRFPLALKIGISSKDYFLSILLSPSIDIYMLPYIVKELIKTIFGKKVKFTITDKSKYTPSPFQVLYEMKYSILLIAILLVGVTKNPIAFLFNFFWMIPFFISPLIIYLIQKD